MCHDFEGWFRRTRSAQPARREHAVPENANRQVDPVPPPKPSEPAPRVEERETLPA